MKIERPEGTVIVPVRGTRYVYKIAEKRYLKDKGNNVNKRICIDNGKNLPEKRLRSYWRRYHDQT